MLGTLNGGLEARGVKLSGDAITADVVGENEMRDGLPVLTRITVHYRLRIPAGTRETVDRLLAKHQSKCPTAASLAPAIEVTWTADIAEAGAGEGAGASAGN
ncbi:MAG: OsmC family protein [Gemmatimonadota bacterium]